MGWFHIKGECGCLFRILEIWQPRLQGAERVIIGHGAGSQDGAFSPVLLETEHTGGRALPSWRRLPGLHGCELSLFLSAGLSTLVNNPSPMTNWNLPWLWGLWVAGYLMSWQQWVSREPELWALLPALPNPLWVISAWESGSQPGALNPGVGSSSNFHSNSQI